MGKRQIDISSWKSGAGASYLGVYFVTVVAIGGLAGNWLDTHFSKSPLFAILGLALGLAAGIREMLKVLTESTMAEAEARRSKAGGVPAAARGGGPAASAGKIH